MIQNVINSDDLSFTQIFKIGNIWREILIFAFVTESIIEISSIRMSNHIRQKLTDFLILFAMSTR